MADKILSYEQIFNQVGGKKEDFFKLVTKNSDTEKVFETLSRASNSSSSVVTGAGSGDKGGSKNVFASLTETLGDFGATQEYNVDIPYLSDEFIKIEDILNKIVDGQGKFNSLSQIGNNIVEGALKGLQTYYKQQTGLLHQINIEAGLTGKLSEAFRENITDASPHLLRLGIGFKDLGDAATKLVTDSGKFSLISSEAFVKAGSVAKAYVGTLQEMVGLFKDFAQVGIGADQTIKDIENAGKTALTLGLRSKTITSDIQKNIGKLNEYGFKNGVEGLSQMARKAVEFRTTIEQTTAIAEKVFNPESALELSANLQVLGGAMGDFNDPLKLMYMATNNVEGLQDALIGAAGSLATYNSEQGRFEITGANLRRAKEMAGQLGMSLGDLSKTAIATAERTSASSALMARGLTLDEKQKEFLTNIAQMKGGKMQIEIQSQGLRDALQLKDGETAIAIDDLTQSQAKLLLDYQKDFEDKTTDEIVRDQATDIENIMRDVNYIAAVVKMEAGRGITDVVDKAFQLFGTSRKEITAEISKMTTKAGMADIVNISKEKLNEQIDKNKKEQSKGQKSESEKTTEKKVETKKEEENKIIKVNQYNVVPAVISEKATPTTNQNTNVTNNTQNTNQQRTNYVTANNTAPAQITSGSQFTTYGGNQQNTTNASSTNNTNTTQTSTASNTSVQNQNLSQIVEKADGTYSVVTNNQVTPSAPIAVTPEGQSTTSTDIKSVITKETSESPLLNSVQSIENFLLTKDFTKSVSTQGIVSVSKPTEVKVEESKSQPTTSTNVEVKPEVNVTPKLATPSLVKTETPKIDYEKLTAGKTPLTLTPQQTPEISTQEKNVTAKIETPNETPTLTPQGVLSKSYETKRFDFSSINVLKEKTDNELRELSILDKDYATKATETFKLNKESLEKYYTTIFGGTNNNTLISEKLNENKEQLSILDRNYSTKATETFKLNEINLEKYYTKIYGGKDTENNINQTLEKNSEQLSILDKNYSTKSTEIFKDNNQKLEKYYTTIFGGKGTENNISQTLEKNSEQLSILDKNYSTKATEIFKDNNQKLEKYYTTIFGGKESENNISQTLEKNSEQLSILDKNYSTKATENLKLDREKLEKYYTTISGGKDTENNISQILKEKSDQVLSVNKSVKEKETNNNFTKLQTGDINNLTAGYNSFLSSLTSNTNIGNTNINTNTEAKVGDTFSSILGGDNTSSVVNQNITPDEKSYNINKGTITAFDNLDREPLPQAVVNPISSSREVSKESFVNIQDTLKQEIAKIEKTVVQGETSPKTINHTFTLTPHENLMSGLAKIVNTSALRDAITDYNDPNSYLNVGV